MHDDPTVALTIDLIERASVTPEDGGCQELLAARLESAGFRITHRPHGEVRNLWAMHGDNSSDEPCLVFAGHTDVVPTGPLEDWDSDPFNAEMRGGRLYGRGATDMKSGLAAMVTAAENYVAGNPEHHGSIAFLLTSDEEGPSIDGTRRVVEWLQETGQKIDYCVIGEASSVAQLGDRVMIGRRGSLSGRLTLHGRQGHVAYPHLADNPIHRMAPLLTELCAIQWDEGNAHFPPTSLQITNIHAGTGASNVIPGDAVVDFNLRYSTEQTAEKIQGRVTGLLEAAGVDADLSWNHSGQPFITDGGRLLEATLASILEITGIAADPSTAGGTSDGRFIAPTGAEVIEIGPRNETAHQVNENVIVDDLPRLRKIYQRLIEQLLDA